MWSVLVARVEDPEHEVVALVAVHRLGVLREEAGLAELDLALEVLQDGGLAVEADPDGVRAHAEAVVAEQAERLLRLLVLLERFVLLSLLRLVRMVVLLNLVRLPVLIGLLSLLRLIVLLRLLSLIRLFVLLKILYLLYVRRLLMLFEPLNFL